MSATSPTALEAAIARRIDFPTWLPAMLVKELRQGVRAKGFVATLFGFQVVMTLFTIFAIAGGSGSNSYNLLQGVFWVMLDVQLLIITPLRALTGLQYELDTRWVDLLLLTRLTAWRAVMGKWVSLLVQSALLVVAMLPYGVARYFFGSVDLVGEGELIVLLFVASAALTAAALWVSALPKLARVALAILVVWMWQLVPGSLMLIISPASRPIATSGMIVPTGSWLLFLFDAMLVLTLCLIGAVRKLAPRAESQSPVARLLPLLALVPLPFLHGTPRGVQAAFTTIFFLVIAALEIARAEEPMAIHWRPWAQRGAWAQWLGRFLQPGWASALEWLLVATAAACVAGALVPTTSRAEVPLLAVLAAEALMFPALMLTWMSSQFSHRAVGYTLVLGGASILGAVAAASGSLSGYAIPDRLLAVLPISSFWSRVWAKALPPIPVMVAQVAVAVAVLGVAWWRARPYRLQRARFAALPADVP